MCPFIATCRPGEQQLLILHDEVGLVLYHDTCACRQIRRGVLNEDALSIWRCQSLGVQVGIYVLYKRLVVANNIGVCFCPIC